MKVGDLVRWSFGELFRMEPLTSKAYIGEEVGIITSTRVTDYLSGDTHQGETLYIVQLVTGETVELELIDLVLVSEC